MDVNEKIKLRRAEKEIKDKTSNSEHNENESGSRKEKKGTKKYPVILFIIPFIAGGLFMSHIKKSNEIEEANKIHYMNMDSFTINTIDQNEPRYAQMTVTIKVTGSINRDKISMFKPSLNSDLIDIAKKYTAKELLENKQLITEEFQKQIKKSAMLDENPTVLFSSYIVQ